MEELHLGWTPNLSDACFEYLQGLPELRHLSFGCSEWDATEAGPSRLAALKHLELLDMKGLSYRDAKGEYYRAYLDALAHLPQLRLLALRSAIDADLEHLGNLSALEELHLYNSEVTDEGLAHLKGVSRLKRLHLHGGATVFYGGTDVTQQGIDELKEAIPSLLVWLIN